MQHFINGILVFSPKKEANTPNVTTTWGRHIPRSFVCLDVLFFKGWRDRDVSAWSCWCPTVPVWLIKTLGFSPVSCQPPERIQADNEPSITALTPPCRRHVCSASVIYGTNSGKQWRRCSQSLNKPNWSHAHCSSVTDPDSDLSCWRRWTTHDLTEIHGPQRIKPAIARSISSERMSVIIIHIAHLRLVTDTCVCWISDLTSDLQVHRDKFTSSKNCESIQSVTHIFIHTFLTQRGSATRVYFFFCIVTYS